MGEDSDNSGGQSDDSLQVNASDETAYRTVPMPMAQSDDEIPTNPTQAVEDEIDFDAETTNQMEARKRPDVAAPDDETGYIDARGLGVAPDGATTKLPATTVMAEVSGTRPAFDDVDTGVEHRRDDAIVRRVVLPNVAPSREPPLDPTRPSLLIAKPVLPNELPQGGPDSRPQLSQPTQGAQIIAPTPVRPKAATGLKPWVAPSGFWRKRGNTKASPVSAVPIDPAELADRGKRAFVVAGVTTVVWIVALIALAVMSWMDPNDAILFALLSILPTTVVVGWLSRPEDREPRIDDLKILARPLAASLLVMLVASLPWQLGEFRLAMRSFADQSPSISAKVLGDRSDAVGMAECRRIIAAYPRAGVADLLAAGLVGRPDVARACIAGAGDVAPLVSGALVGIWAGALADKRTSTDGACQVAKSMTALDRPPGEVETRLLSCIMTAPPEVRTCCGDALAAAHNGGTPDWVARVEAEPSYVPDEPTAASLLALTFGSPQVSDAQKEIVKRAGFEGAPAQRMAIVFACAASKAGANLGGEFVGSLGRCAIDPEKYTRSREVWLEVCSRAQDRVIRRRQDPRESLCQAAMAVGVEGAAASANSSVAEGVERARASGR